MATMSELKVTDKPHKHDDLRIQPAQEVRDYAARFGPAYWIFVDPAPEKTWSYDKCEAAHPRTENHIFSKCKESGHFSRSWHHNFRTGSAQAEKKKASTCTRARRLSASFAFCCELPQYPHRRQDLPATPHIVLRKFAQFLKQPRLSQSGTVLTKSTRLTNI